MIQPTCPPTNLVAGSFLLPLAKDCSHFRVYKRMMYQITITFQCTVTFL